MQIVRTNSDHPHFIKLIVELDKHLAGRYTEQHAVYDQYNKVPGLQTVVIAYHNNVPVACGAFKGFDNNTVEIKRMFVSVNERGRGFATAVLHELENWAKELSYTTAVLETGTKQHEAIALYKKEGYIVTENYGQYIGMSTSICMKKQLE